MTLTSDKSRNALERVGLGIYSCDVFRVIRARERADSGVSFHTMESTITRSFFCVQGRAHPPLVMGQTNLFEASNQLNQLIRKMIHCFEALETPHAGQKCVNATKTQAKTCIKTDSKRFIYILSFSRHFYPKRLTNEDNGSNQNQQKSNNMQVL